MSFEVHQERDVLPRRKVLAVYVAAIVIVGAAVVCAGVLMRAARRAPPPTERPPEAPAQIATVERTPIRQTARGLTLARAQRAALERWGWADRDAGIGEIPIDVAIDLLAEQAPADGGDR